MDIEQFHERAARFQELARRSPGEYNRRLRLLVALGYGYVAAILLALVVLNVVVLALTARGGGFVAAKVLLALVVFTGVVLRAMWVRIDPPQGVPLSREEAPKLFRMVDELRASLRAKPVHRVQVTDVMNASMAQVPRLGIFGWHRNYLTLGLPFLQGLSPEQLRAVVAHELAHLSAQHSRVGAWIYRVTATWHRLIAELDARGSWGVKLFRPFFRWYVPYFDAFTLVLSRQNEFEADRLAARAMGPDGARVCAAALARVEMLGRREEEAFWPAYVALAEEHAAPPYGPYAARRQGVGAAADPERAAAWVAAGLGYEGSPFDTHPSLRERMEALGHLDVPEAVEAPERSAAEELLGKTAERLAERFDREWLDGARQGWEQRHAEVRARRSALEELDRAAAEGAVPPTRALEHALLVEEARGAAEARPLMEALVARQPDDSEARFYLGRLLLNEGDDAGLAHLDAAMDADLLCTPAAAGMAYHYLTARGRSDEAERYRRRLEAHEHELHAAREERGAPMRGQEVEAHSATPEQVRELRTVLEGFPAVKGAWLVRRKLARFAEVPCHLVVLEFSSFTSDDKENEVVEKVAGRVGFLGDVWVAGAGRAGLKGKARKVTGSRVYERFDA